MEKSLVELSKELERKLDTKQLDLRTYSPLTLAFIGDSIYDLMIRTMVVKEANRSNHVLHKKCARLVKAETQSMMMDGLLSLLTEEEEHVYKRGRNAKMTTMAKNASMLDYKKATGFEALMGYLYLKGENGRLLQLVAAALAVFDEKI